MNSARVLACFFLFVPCIARGIETKGFDFPLGKPNGIGYAAGILDNPDDGNGFLEKDSASYKCGTVFHPGEDWNAITRNDDGDSVYAAADGIIEYAGDPHSGGWRNIILIHHSGNFLLPNGEIINEVWTQYGHLASISNKSNSDQKWKLGDIVKRGEEIGTVGDFYGAYHLHFEVRSIHPERQAPQNFVCGFSKKQTEDFYLPPSEFINLNRPSRWLNVNLVSTSSSPTPPTTVSLAAHVSGLEQGPITYTVYCNRPDDGTNITDGYDRQVRETNENPLFLSDVCRYDSVGTYTAKVIVERGSMVVTDKKVITIDPSSTEVVWPMYHHDADRTAHSLFRGPANPAHITTIPGTSSGCPVIDRNGTIYSLTGYTSTGGTSLRKINQQGSVVQQIPTPLTRPIEAILSPTEDRVYLFDNYYDALVSYALPTLTFNWARAFGTSNLGGRATLTEEDQIYLTTDENVLSRNGIDVSSRWPEPFQIFPWHVDYSTPMVMKDLGTVLVWDLERFRWLDDTTGQQIRTLTRNAYTQVHMRFGGFLYTTDTNGVVAKRDPATLFSEWTAPIGDSACPGATVTGGYAMAGNINNQIIVGAGRAISAFSTAGDLQWRYCLGTNEAVEYGTFATDIDGSIYGIVRTLDGIIPPRGRVVSLDSQGNLRWDYPTELVPDDCLVLGKDELYFSRLDAVIRIR